MFQGRGVILKGGVDVCHAGMPGIASIREKTQIRKAEFFDQPAFCLKSGLI